MRRLKLRLKHEYLIGLLRGKQLEYREDGIELVLLPEDDRITLSAEEYRRLKHSSNFLFTDSEVLSDEQLVIQIDNYCKVLEEQEKNDIKEMFPAIKLAVALREAGKRLEQHSEKLKKCKKYL